MHSTKERIAHSTDRRGFTFLAAALTTSIVYYREVRTTIKHKNTAQKKKRLWWSRVVVAMRPTSFLAQIPSIHPSTNLVSSLIIHVHLRYIEQDKTGYLPNLTYLDVQLHANVVAQPPLILAGRPLQRREQVVFVAAAAEVGAGGARDGRGRGVAAAVALASPLLEPAPFALGAGCVCLCFRRDRRRVVGVVAQRGVGACGRAGIGGELRERVGGGGVRADV